MFTLIPVLGVLIGLGMFAWCAYAHSAGRETRSWPSVKGTVLRSGVKEQRFVGEASDFTYYVAYQYSVGGRTYESDRLAFGAKLVRTSWNAAEEEVKRYRAGARVWVFYDPANPASAVLQVGSQNVLAIFLIGLAFLVGAVLLLVSPWLAS